jgi:hypothetical protein
MITANKVIESVLDIFRKRSDQEKEWDAWGFKLYVTSEHPFHIVAEGKSVFGGPHLGWQEYPGHVFDLHLYGESTHAPDRDTYMLLPSLKIAAFSMTQHQLEGHYSIKIDESSYTSNPAEVIHKLIQRVKSHKSWRGLDFPDRWEKHPGAFKSWLSPREMERILGETTIRSSSKMLPR